MILSPISTWPGELANDPGPKLEVITNACPSRPGHRLVLWRTVSAAVLQKVRTFGLALFAELQAAARATRERDRCTIPENSASKENVGAPFLLRY